MHLHIDAYTCGAHELCTRVEPCDWSAGAHGVTTMLGLSLRARRHTTQVMLGLSLRARRHTTQVMLGLSLRARRHTTQVMLGVSLRARWDTTIVHIITEDGYRDAAIALAYNLLLAVRQLRLRYLAHRLRLPHVRVVRRTLAAMTEGSLFIDCQGSELKELETLAMNRTAWQSLF